MAENRGIDVFNLTLAAGTSVGFEMPGDWWHVFEAPVNDLEVSFDSGRWTPWRAGVGARRYYKRVDVRSATGQAVQIGIGFGSVQDGRGSVSGFTVNTTVTPGNTLDDGGDVAIAATSQELLSGADADRLYLLITVPDDADGPVRVGSVAVGATSGVLVQPGTSLPLATTAAVYAYNPSATDSVTVSVASVREV